MPPKPEPRKRHRSTKNQPLTFSPFARTMASSSSNKKAHQQFHPNSPTNNPNSSGNPNLENSSDSEESEGFDGTVQADFAFFDPKPTDFHGVKVLLQMYLDNKQWDISSFVDLIIDQPTVGSVVKIEDDADEGVYAVISALSFGRHVGKKCMSEVKDYIFKVCNKDKEVISKLNGLFGGDVGKVGLIVSQYVVNLPPQLLPHLYDALFNEIEWATEDEPTKELRESFKFEYYLVISKMYERKSGVGKGLKKSGEEAVIYVKPEDEIWMEVCAWSVNFPLQVQQVSSDELKNYRLMGLVMCVEASKVKMFRQRLHSLIDESV